VSDDYDRTSRVTTTAELPAPLERELARVAAAQGIADVAVAASFTAETHSRRTRAGGFFARVMGLADPDTEHWTCVVLTRAAVLVGVHGEKRGTRVFFLPLATLELDSMPGGSMIAFAVDRRRPRAHGVLLGVLRIRGRRVRDPSAAIRG
jgi:hypothetical protein